MSWNDNFKRYNPEQEGYGNASQWKRAFKSTMTGEEAATIVKDESPEAILGITEKFYDFAWLKKVFRAKIMAAHPDKGGTTKDAQKIIAAYTILKEKFGEK